MMEIFLIMNVELELLKNQPRLYEIKYQFKFLELINMNNTQMMAQLLKQDVYCKSGKLKHLVNDKIVQKYIDDLD